MLICYFIASGSLAAELLGVSKATHMHPIKKFSSENTLRYPSLSFEDLRELRPPQSREQVGCIYDACI